MIPSTNFDQCSFVAGAGQSSKEAGMPGSSSADSVGLKPSFNDDDDFYFFIARRVGFSRSY